MSKSEYKKLKSKIINELRFNNSNHFQRNIVPKGKFISMIDIVEMEGIAKKKKLDAPKFNTPIYSKSITDIKEIYKKLEDENNKQFINLFSTLEYVKIYTIINEDSYEKLDKIYGQVVSDIKSNNYTLQWFLTELEKQTKLKANNLPETLMLLKKAAREKNKQLVIHILKDQPELLEQFKIATKYR